MSIPDYQTLMLPVLKLAADEKEHKFSQAVEELADEFNLSKEERNELLPSGSQAVFNNRVGWARSYLKQAGLLKSPRRGYFIIAQNGLDLLTTNPSEIDVSVLEQYPEFIEFKNRKKDKAGNESQVDSSNEKESTQTPEDALASAYKSLRLALESEVLSSIKEASPSFFERLVVDLLVKMGYGGNRQDAGRALGKSGDGGIDGIINEDRLGLDVIYTSEALGGYGWSSRNPKIRWCIARTACSKRRIHYNLIFYQRGKRVCFIYRIKDHPN